MMRLLPGVQGPNMKIIISGRAVASDRATKKEINQPEKLRALDGITYDRLSCCDTLDRGLDEIGLIGGLVRLAYPDDGHQLRVITEYQSPRALTSNELQTLTERTRAQWSDGIGESSFWANVGPGVAVDLYPLFLDHDVRTEQFDDGVVVPEPKKDPPLVKAAEDGDVELIRALLAQGEDANAVSRYGSPILDGALIRGHVEAARLLIDHGALPGPGSLHHACREQNSTPELLEALVIKGADVNGRDDRGATPLMWAANRGLLGLARWLLDHGADPNLRDTHQHNEGRTALMYAQRLDVLEFLLEQGADPNVRDDRGLAAYEMTRFQAGDGTRRGIGEAERHQRHMVLAEAILKALRRRAEAGDAASQYTLAEYHDRGLGVPEDVDEAFRWYERSASGGYRLAWVRLGLCYRDGHGTAIDLAKALDCLGQGADAGVPLAMGILGECYGEGQGVGRDEAEAAGWYGRGAEIDPVAGVQANEIYDFRSGVAACRAELGACSENGKGVARDLNEALRWYESALDLGFHPVSRAIQRVRKALRK
jgi:TPR repeat protein